MRPPSTKSSLAWPILLAFGIVLALATQAGAQTIALGTGAGSQGETVSLPLDLTTGDSEPVALQVDVGFSSTRLTPVVASLGEAAADHEVHSSVPTAGVMRVVVYSPTNTPLADGPVAVLSFTIKPTAPEGATALILSGAVLATSGAVAFSPASQTQGSITVGGSSPTTDLELVKSASILGGGENPPVSFTITVTNSGSEAVTGATVTDYVPPVVTAVSWTCVPDAGSTCTPSGAGDIQDFIDLQPGDSVTYSANGILTSDTEETATNTAWVSCPTGTNDSDAANNIDSAVLAIDPTPPSVARVDTVESTEDGNLDSDERTAASITQIGITYSKPMKDAPGDADPDDVTNPSNYRLFEAGANRLLETTSCGPAVGDDIAIDIPLVTYRSEGDTAFLATNGAEALPAGSYRVIASGFTSIVDLFDNLLDGNGDGTGGDDFVRDFSVVLTNLLDNPNLDDDLELVGWTASNTSEVTFADDDADGAPTSGSIQVVNLEGAGSTATVSQCVSVWPGMWYGFGGLVRIESTFPGDPDVIAVAEPYTDTSCEGPPLGSAASAVVSGTTAGLFSDALTGAVLAPDGTAAVKLSVRIDAGDATSYQLNLDNLFLDDSVIFMDDFEAGSTTAWSGGVR